MQSVLIVHSPHTKYYAEIIAKQPQFNEVEYMEVTKSPGPEVLKLKTIKDVVIAVGGGSVIDTAKIIARRKRVIAIPTTAAGAACTPFASIWYGDRKETIKTRKPLLATDYYGMDKCLPPQIKNDTLCDCIAHAHESKFSKKANFKSITHADKAIKLLGKYQKTNNMNDLINAGNEAGKAITITGTNVIHACSYALTYHYGIPHGKAVAYMLGKLGTLIGVDVSVETTGIHGLDKEYLITEAFKYKKIHSGKKDITPEMLRELLWRQR